jgi:hypothetical protein
VIVRGDIFWQTITREEESLPVGLARRQVDIPDAPMRYATQCCSHQWQFNLPGDGPQTVDNLRASARATATLCLSCYPKLSFSKEMTKSKAWLVLDIMVVSVNFRNCGDSEVGRKSARPSTVSIAPTNSTDHLHTPDIIFPCSSWCMGSV